MSGSHIHSEISRANQSAKTPSDGDGIAMEFLQYATGRMGAKETVLVGRETHMERGYLLMKGVGIIFPLGSGCRDLPETGNRRVQDARHPSERLAL